MEHVHTLRKRDDAEKLQYTCKNIEYGYDFCHNGDRFWILKADSAFAEI